MYFGISSSCMAFLTGLIMVSADKRFNFGYDGEEANDVFRQVLIIGPDHFETCAGKYQSPINIEEHMVQQVQLLPLEFHGFDALPSTSTLSNNGHTVMLELNTTEVASVTGGPLKGEYIFAQLHFHWGANDSFGSEDMINNHSYPMELHMVSYKADYGDSSEAGKYEDGLVVMAFFFEVIDTDNPVYSEIVGKLPSITMPDTNVRLNQQLSLGSLMNDNRRNYYTYHGSLTTPPCSEVVTWLDFKEPVLLSHQQLEAFRTLQSHEGPMTHNNRPTQPLGERLVWFNEADLTPSENIHGVNEGKNSRSGAEGVRHSGVAFAVLLACITQILPRHF